VVAGVCTCKLDGELVKKLQDRAAAHPGGMTGLLNDLLSRGLAEAGTDA
jgi:hypothetical protein